MDIIRRAAISLLTRRDYAQKELARKLISKGYSKQDIETVVMQLVQENLINEDRIIENFIYWRRTKGYGPERIMMELQTRGVSEDKVKEKLDMTSETWLIKIEQVWRKQFKGKEPVHFKDRAKQMRFLQYRGFTSEQIDHVFRLLKER